MGTYGSTIATSGMLRTPDTFNITWNSSATNYALCSGQGTMACLGGPYPTRPGTALVDATSYVALQLNGGSQLLLGAGYQQWAMASVYWAVGTVTPSLSQVTDTTPGTIGDQFLIHAQDVNSTGAASTAGILLLRGGDGYGISDIGGNIVLRPGYGGGGDGTLILKDGENWDALTINDSRITLFKLFKPYAISTAEKELLVATEGDVVYDTTLQKLCVYNGLLWETVTSGGPPV